MEGLQQDLNAEAEKPSAFDSLARVLRMKGSRNRSRRTQRCIGQTLKMARDAENQTWAGWVTGKQAIPLRMVGICMDVRQQEDTNGSPISGLGGCCCHPPVWGREHRSDRKETFLIDTHLHLWTSRLNSLSGNRKISELPGSQGGQLYTSMKKTMRKHRKGRLWGTRRRHRQSVPSGRKWRNWKEIPIRGREECTHWTLKEAASILGKSAWLRCTEEWQGLHLHHMLITMFLQE